jgi:hypothetical protein
MFSPYEVRHGMPASMLAVTVTESLAVTTRA